MYLGIYDETSSAAIGGVEFPLSSIAIEYTYFGRNWSMTVNLEILGDI